MSGIRAVNPPNSGSGINSTDSRCMASLPSLAASIACGGAPFRLADPGRGEGLAPTIAPDSAMEPTPRRSPPWLVVLATLTGNLFLVIGSIILGVVTILVGWIPPRGRWAFGVMRIWANGLLAAAMVRVEVRYAPELEPGKSYVFLSNHRSLFDIPVLLATSPGQIRMVAKRSLFLIPIFGWGLTAGRFIPVDRADRSTAGRTFAQAAERLKEGTSILMFPEGTRGVTDV